MGRKISVLPDTLDNATMEQLVGHTSEQNRQYVLLAYRDENQWHALSAPERTAFERACLASEQELRQNGYLFAAEDRPTTHTAITLRVVNGQLSLNDGPFVSAKGPSLELFFIQTRDLNEAIQVAAKMPQAHHGCIEIRPLLAP
jgi:hypothetical protein